LSCVLYYESTFFYFYYWIGTSACVLVVPEEIIRPLVGASAMTWFIRYICLEFIVPK